MRRRGLKALDNGGMIMSLVNHIENLVNGVAYFVQHDGDMNYVRYEFYKDTIIGDKDLFMDIWTSLENKESIESIVNYIIICFIGDLNLEAIKRNII